MQQQVFEYFKQISQIPRESGNETGIANYIMKLAESENWESYRDESNNVLIKKAASIGYENAPVVMLQGHMDMVCEKKPGVLHDFSKDPIKLRTIDDYIYADGTTLGADNGIGLAMCLSVLKDNKLKHPPLEVLFTVSEEKGMKGVQALDGSKFNSSILINLDSEGEGVFTAGCAGGQRIALSLPLKRKKIEDRKCYRIAVCGLKGGHSGDDIDKQRGNAIKILGRILADIRDDISLCSLKGGTKENVIPSEAEALVAVSNDSILREKIILWNEILRNEYQYSDPEIKVILDNCSDIEECLEDDIASKIVTAINLLPNGVNTKNNEIDLVVSSDNIGVVEEYPDKIEIKISIRSSIKSNIFNDIAVKIKYIADLLGFEYVEGSYYPGWEYKEESYIRRICIETYERMFGKKAKVEAIHAGLECGYLIEKIGNLDAISFGPQLYDIHTTNEHVSISSVENTYKLLCEVLEQIR